MYFKRSRLDGGMDVLQAISTDSHLSHKILLSSKHQ